MAKVARAVRITGHVQGVYFRGWTQAKARQLGVTGWVRNAADGSVEAHVEGDEDKVAELIIALGYGPDHARVATVERHDIEPEAASGFDIRH